MARIQHSEFGGNLERRVLELLPRVMELVPIKGGVDLHPGPLKDSSSYSIDERGISRYYKGRHTEGYAVTLSEHVSQEEFLTWLQKQPQEVIGEVYNRLLSYIHRPIPKKDSEDSIQPDYLV